MTMIHVVCIVMTQPKCPYLHLQHRLHKQMQHNVIHTSKITLAIYCPFQPGDDSGCTFVPVGVSLWVGSHGFCHGGCGSKG